jgi:hypothetical protein
MKRERDRRNGFSLSLKKTPINYRATSGGFDDFTRITAMTIEDASGSAGKL